MSYKLSAYERETIVRWDEDGKMCDIWTASRAVADRLIRAGVKPTSHDEWGWSFELPKSAVRLKPGNKAIRPAGNATSRNASPSACTIP